MAPITPQMRSGRLGADGGTGSPAHSTPLRKSDAAERPHGIQIGNHDTGSRSRVSGEGSRTERKRSCLSHSGRCDTNQRSRNEHERSRITSLCTGERKTRLRNTKLRSRVTVLPNCVTEHPNGVIRIQRGMSQIWICMTQFGRAVTQIASCITDEPWGMTQFPDCVTALAELVTQFARAVMQIRRAVMRPGFRGPQFPGRGAIYFPHLAPAAGRRPSNGAVLREDEEC